MTLDPKTLTSLGVHLHGRQIGTITRLAGDRQIFAFDESYIDDPQRPTLSLSFKGRSGGLVTAPQQVRQRCYPKDICAPIWPSKLASIRSVSSSCWPPSEPILPARSPLRRSMLAAMIRMASTMTTTTLLSMSSKTIGAESAVCAFRWQAYS